MPSFAYGHSAGRSRCAGLSDLPPGFAPVRESHQARFAGQAGETVSGACVPTCPNTPGCFSHSAGVALWTGPRDCPCTWYVPGLAIATSPLQIRAICECPRWTSNAQQSNGLKPACHETPNRSPNHHNETKAAHSQTTEKKGVKRKAGERIRTTDVHLGKLVPDFTDRLLKPLPVVA